MFKKTWLSLSVGALILTLMVALSEWNSAPRHVKDEECRVYEAIYMLSDAQDRFFFEPETISFNSVDRFGTQVEAPSSFLRETGEFEEITLELDGSTFERPIVEKFEVDTSGFFEPVRTSDVTSLEKCFDRLEHPPRFFAGQFQELIDNDPDADPVGDGMVTHLMLARVSRVGFSEDQQSALFYMEHHCGGLCGAGEFVFLERVEEDWQIAGSSTKWIS